MRHLPFKEHIQYRFEKFVVKGLGHQLVVLIVVFLVVYLFSFLFRMTIEFISGIERNTLRISHLLKSFELISLYPLEKFNVLSQLLVQSALEREYDSITRERGTTTSTTFLNPRKNEIFTSSTNVNDGPVANPATKGTHRRFGDMARPAYGDLLDTLTWKRRNPISPAEVSHDGLNFR